MDRQHGVFLSDRDGPFTLYAYDTAHPRRRRSLLRIPQASTSSASANDGAIVYSSSMRSTVRSRDAHRSPRSDIDRRRYAASAPALDCRRGRNPNAEISPTGVRAVFEAHGDILTVPAENGEFATSRKRRAPPNATRRGRPTAVDCLFLRRVGRVHAALKGSERARTRARHSARHLSVVLLFADLVAGQQEDRLQRQALGLYYIDIAQEHPQGGEVRDASAIENFAQIRSMRPGRRTAATSRTPTTPELPACDLRLRYARRTHVPGDRRNERLDASRVRKCGKYLYFLASTNTGSTTTVSTWKRRAATSSSVYASSCRTRRLRPSLRKATKNRSRPTSRRAGQAGRSRAGRKHPPPLQSRRSTSTTSASASWRCRSRRQLRALSAGGKGTNLLGPGSARNRFRQPPTGSILVFDMESRKAQPLASARRVVYGFVRRQENARAAARQDDGTAGRSSRRSADEAGRRRTRSRAASKSTAFRSEEWAQMYRETWRIERDYFYDPHYHGLDIARRGTTLRGISARPWRRAQTSRTSPKR